MRQRPPKPEGREKSPRFKKKDASVNPGDKIPSPFSRALLKSTLSEEAMIDRLVSLEASDDSTVAIMAAAYLENRLELILAHSFVNLDREEYARIFDGAGNSILGTFSAKIRMAYAMKLIHRNPYKALFLINAIRVAFAHSLTIVRFDNPAIAADCQQLRGISPNLTSAAGLMSSLIPGADESARDIFLKIVFALYISLDAKRIKLKVDGDWPPT
jgi:hypothetical protein